jgi:hypothetical protein
MAIMAEDPNYNPVEMAALQAQIITIVQAAQDKMRTIQQQAVNQDMQIWQTMFKGMGSGFSQAIVNLVNGSKTFQQAMQQMLKSIFDDIVKTLADWVTQHLATMAMNLLATKTASVGQAQAQAAVAGAGGVASMAAAPWPIDMTAPVFGASMAAEAMSFAAAGAQEGYDVPAGVMPVTQLHPKEMVLPKELADVIRNMAAGGTSGRGGSVNIGISAMDGRSVERVLRGHPKEMQRTLTRLHGQFAK